MLSFGINKKAWLDGKKRSYLGEGKESSEIHAKWSGWEREKCEMVWAITEPWKKGQTVDKNDTM